MEILVLVILIVINGLFAMSEIALITARRARLSRLAEDGDHAAAIAIKLGEEPTRFLSTIQIGITSIGILNGIVGEAALAGPLASWLQTLGMEQRVSEIGSTVLVVLVITYVSIVVGELVPKRIGQINPEGIARLVARPMYFLSIASRPFVHLLSSSTALLLRLMGQREVNGPSVTEEEIYRAVNRAEPSLIRTEADELTYSLHIMVRYELEKALMQGTLTVADLPAAWNAKYKEYLGVDVPDDTHGCLQDIHWAMGDMGYFPSYALGSAYSAQAVDDLRKTMDLDAQWAEGNMQPLKDALRSRVWQHGRAKEPQWLVQSLCGGAFDAAHYTNYLKNKYTELYGL